MTRAEIAFYLAEAETLVSLATANVDRQRKALTELARIGVPAPIEQATTLLVTLEDSLRLHRKERDRLNQELAAVTAAEGAKPRSSISSETLHTRGH